MNYSNYDDIELIKLVIEKRDEGVFKEIYNRYNKMMYNFIRKYLYYASKTCVEELVNEVFINVFLKITTLKNKDKFKQWIYQIAHNLCKNYIRDQRAKKDVNYIPDNLPDKDANVENDFINNEIQKCLFNEISKFNDKDREVFLLRFHQKLTYKEISKTTKISVRSLKYRVKKSVQELQLKLKVEGFY